MRKKRISIALCLAAALGCVSGAACSGGGGKATLRLIGTSGVITLVARSSVGHSPDASDGSDPVLVMMDPKR